MLLVGRFLILMLMLIGSAGALLGMVFSVLDDAKSAKATLLCTTLCLPAIIMVATVTIQLAD